MEWTRFARAAALGVLVPVLALRVAVSEAAAVKWQGRGEAGFVLARGNTDTETANLKIDLQRIGERWSNELAVVVLRATASDVTSAARHEVRTQTNFALARDRSWFGGLRYARDRFGAFDYEATASTGYRHQVSDSEVTRFSAQLGVGYRKLQDAVSRLVEDDAVAQASLNLDRSLTSSTRVINHLSAEAGGRNTLIENRLALEVKMNTAFALSLATVVRFNSQPPPERKETDTLTTVNLVYAFPRT